MTPPRRRRVVSAAAAAIAVTLTLVTGPAAIAVSKGAVISEAYGGGGNSGATLTNDFIELGNRGSAPVSLDGWTVQYLPAQPSPASRWQATPLGGSLRPDARYLVAEARGSGGTTELATADATGSIAMAAGAGTVALVRGTAPLTCLTAADCAAADGIVDLVG